MNEHIDWAECAREYDLSRLRIDDLVRSTDPDRLSTTVQACPAWTVKDLIAHNVSIPVALVAGETGGGDDWVAQKIDERRDRSVDELLDEWSEVAPDFVEMMASDGGRSGGLLLDVVAHEHDLRHALDRPGARTERGVVLTVGINRLLISADLKRHAPDEDARPVVRFGSDDGIWQAGGTGDPTITLDLSGRPEGSFTLMRVFGSRRSLDQLVELPWTGDWRSAHDGLFHMPLPDQPIVE